MLNSDLWLEKICNLSYFESVLNVKVPTMTSDTSSETAYSNSLYKHNDGSYPYPAWHAFDENDNTLWNSADGNQNSVRIQYGFTSAMKLKAVKIVPWNNSNLDCTFDIIASNTGQFNGEEITLSSITVNQNKTKMISINNNNDYLFYGLRCMSKSGNYFISDNNFYYVIIATIQFYGR